MLFLINVTAFNVFLKYCMGPTCVFFKCHICNIRLGITMYIVHSASTLFFKVPNDISWPRWGTKSGDFNGLSTWLCRSLFLPGTTHVLITLSGYIFRICKFNKHHRAEFAKPMIHVPSSNNLNYAPLTTPIETSALSWWGGLCVSMTQKAMLVGVLASGRSKHAAQVKG